MLNPGETKLITDIATSDDTESSTVTLSGSQNLTYSAIKQVFPLGVLFHFPETALDNIKEVYYPPHSKIIASIRATQIEEANGTTSRIFIALKEDLPYSIIPDADGIHISFPMTGQPAAEKSAPQMPEKVAKAPKPAKMAAPPATRITEIAAASLKNSVAVTVKADGTIKNYKVFTIEKSPPRIVYDLYGLKSSL